MRGFQYCDLLLVEAERAAWRQLLAWSGRASDIEPDTRHAPLLAVGTPSSIQDDASDRFKRLIILSRSVSERAAHTLDWAERSNLSLEAIGLDHLTHVRAALYNSILSGDPPPRPHLNEAVDFLRRSGQQVTLPHALLTRALFRTATGAFDGAREDLDEAFEIAERGPMRLHLADIHLHRARLFGLIANRPAAYPWVSARDDLDKARKLIDDCGYGRRREELEDAEAAWERLYGAAAPCAAT